MNKKRDLETFWQPNFNQQKLVAPSILSADFANLERDICAVAKAGADWVHVDIMDGHFVPNLTIGVPVVESINKISPLPLDVHLMIDHPEKYIDSFVKAGSDIITIHVESTHLVRETLAQIRRQKVKAGITLRPKTSLNEIMPYLHEVDLILIMTIEPGFGGQSFMLDQVEKIKILRQEIIQKNLPILIEVDGGINDKTFMSCQDVDVFVAGTFIFKNDYNKSIQLLKSK